jgi:hypothetical protein
MVIVVSFAFLYVPQACALDVVCGYIYSRFFLRPYNARVNIPPCYVVLYLGNRVI